MAEIDTNNNIQEDANNNKDQENDGVSKEKEKEEFQSEQIPKRVPRPFATGSKPGPDIIDHQLEKRGYFRKHVARDASSLFRSVAEFVFDIQNYAEDIRQNLASYIEMKVNEYGNEINMNLYTYCTQLRRNRTYGTLFDLKVLARMYRRDVILFEPTANNEIYEHLYVKCPEETNEEPIRLYYSQKDKHFDVIFTMSKVESLAESQGMVYKILYDDVFKLPDMNYAVERMLHDPEGNKVVPLENDKSKYISLSGEIIPFSTAEETNCVLKDPRTCAFHNKVDFEKVVEENKDLVTIINRSDDPGKLKFFKQIDGFLFDKDVSCVRQLTEMRISSCPFKTLKGRDPYIYRNTDFEIWSEARKQLRTKWLDSNGLPIREYADYSYDYQKKSEKKHSLDHVAYNDVHCVDYCEGKKYESGYEPFAHMDHFQPSRHLLEPLVMPIHTNYNNYRGNRRGGGFNADRQEHYNNNRNEGFRRSRFDNNQGGDFNPQHHSRYHYNRNHNANYQQQQQDSVQRDRPTITFQQEPVQNFSEMNSAPPLVQYEHQLSPPPIYQAIPQTPQFVYGPPTPAPQYTAQLPFVSQPVASHPGIVNYTNYSVPPPIITSNADMNLVRESELLANINYNVHESTESNGVDILSNDVQTLRFFFNLGVRYFAASGSYARYEEIINRNSALQSTDSSRSEELSVRNENVTPVPTNTPVSSKMTNNNNFASSSNNRFQNRPGDRRSQGCQQNGNKDGSEGQDKGKDNRKDPRKGRNGNNNGKENMAIGSNAGNISRKEFQFNSNVKNIHRIDPGKAVTNQISLPVALNSFSSASASSNLVKMTSSNQLTAQNSMPILQSQLSQEKLAGNATPVTVTPVAISPIAPPLNIQNEIQACSSADHAQWQSAAPAQPIYSQYQPTTSYLPAQPIYLYQNEKGELIPYPPQQQQYYYANYPPPQQAFTYYAQQQQVTAQPAVFFNSNQTSDSAFTENSSYSYPGLSFTPPIIQHNNGYYSQSVSCYQPNAFQEQVVHHLSGDSNIAAQDSARTSGQDTTVRDDSDEYASESEQNGETAHPTIE